MPEMLHYCGKQFRVHQRVNKICLDSYREGFRQFEPRNVILLKEVRCTGESHDQCNRNCLLFWKDAWLKLCEQPDENVVEDQNLAHKKHENRNPETPNESASHSHYSVHSQHSLLKTRLDDGRFFCQSTELAKATVALPVWRRPAKSIDDVRAGNMSIGRAISTLFSTTVWKIRGRMWGQWPRGPLEQTPTESLDLQPGEVVEVKPYREIVATLDNDGRNRGLLFGMDMRKHCGKQYRVSRRVDQIILEKSGQMIPITNTVLLEGVTCRCIFAIGGCPRAEVSYWREIWLKRVPKPA